MYISEPISLTAMYIENDSLENKYKGLLTANFQDYLDSFKMGAELELKSAKLKAKFAALGSGLGIGAGAMGGPAGMALGYSIGNVIGKYAGSATANKLYGQAIEDVAEISLESKQRHAQIASYIAHLGQISSGITTLRENENKRKKDDLQAMQV